MTDQYRPKKLSNEDREVYITLDGEVSLRVINAGDNPQLVGRAMIGTNEASAKWQIMRLLYDANDNISSIQWPLDSQGKPSSEYKFSWGPQFIATITGVDLGPTTKVYATNNYGVGNKLYIQGVKGTTGLNFTGSNLYTVTARTGSYLILDCDSTGMNAYTSGGETFKSTALQNGFG